MLRYRQQSRRDHVVSLLPPISIATSQPMTVEERIFSDTPPPMTYTGSFPSKVLRHLDKTTFYSTPTKGEEALVNKVMHDDMPKNDVTQPDSTADQTQRSSKSNKRVNTSSNKREQAKNNSIKSLPSVQRRCTSAPSLKDETTEEGLLEVGNLTAPSTPRPTLTPHHGNHMLTDSKNGKEQNKNGFQFELRGDGFGLHSSADENATQLPVARPNTRAASTPVDEQQQQQHLQQQQLQQQKQHYQHQQLQQHHPPLHKQQQQVQGSKARSLSVGQVQKQKPKFEIRAVGFPLSPREKPDNRNRTSTKPVETCLKTEPDYKVEVDKLKSEQSDITVRIPVIANETNSNDNNNDGNGTNDNNNDGNDNDNNKDGNDNDNNYHDNDKDKNNNSKNNDTKVIVDIDKGNGVNECDNNNNDVTNHNALPSDNNNNDKANHEETNATKTNDKKPSHDLTTNKHNEEKEVSTKKEKKKAQSKGQKNSKQHTKKK